MQSHDVVASLVGAEPDLALRWSRRFGAGELPAVAAEMLRATIENLDGGQVSTVTDPALALGVLRAQQGHSATSLVEDVLSLRPLLWGHVAALELADLGLLILVQDWLTLVLDRAVQDAVAAFVDESTRVLAAQATRDVLTGLGNRAEFNTVLIREIGGAPRDGAPALLLLDLDRFKQVNDTLGHLVGDEVLVHVARVLERACRPTDVPCRLGGDEFTVILPRTDTKAAEKVATRILRELAADPWLAKLSAPVGTSIGLALLPEPKTPAELVAMADSALYRSKAAGGSRCEVATTDDLDEARAAGVA